MGAIISLAICIILCIIFCVFCGYITKAINESKGYTGGFWLGLLLQPIGILIVAYKKEQPNAKANAFRVVPVQKVLKKFRYPFAPPQFEPIAMLKGEIDAEAKAAGLNLTFMLIHGVFMLGWYSVILGAYLWYIMGYAVYWLFKSQSLKKIVDDAKPDAAEKVAFAKEKTRAAFEGLKDKAAALAAEHKKSSDEKIPVADECNREENYNTSSDETVYQGDEEYSDEAADPIADDDTSYEHESDENNSPALEQSSIICKKESQVWENAADDTNIQPAPMSSSPVYNTGTYSYNENKKSPIIYILIGVISVLLVVLGVLFGMLVMKNKSENNNSGTDVMYGASTETTSDTEEMITTSSDSSSENKTQPQTKITSQLEDIPSEEQIMEAVQKAMYAHLDAELSKEKTDDFYYFDRDVKYALYDINADGINELFISYQNVESTGSDLYIYKNGEYIKSYDFYTGADICLSEQLLRENVYGGGEMTKIYVISYNEILQKDELKLLYGYGTTFYHNDFVISESEYNQLISTYDSMNWIHVPDNSRAFSDMIDISAYQQNNTNSSDPYAATELKTKGIEFKSQYEKYHDNNLENAPEDMEFFNQELEGISIPRGKKSGNDKIALRKGPDKKYEAIFDDLIIVENATTVIIYGISKNWYYVYFHGGAGGGLNYYMGYIEKDKLIEFYPDEENTSTSKKYTTYDTSTAGSDFSFNNDAYQRKIITENDPLNLRAAPSTSAEVIIQMPKGSDILLWGVNAEWAYVSYTENGITYYGYANREFIGVP